MQKKLTAESIYDEFLLESSYCGHISLQRCNSLVAAHGCTCLEAGNHQGPAITEEFTLNNYPHWHLSQQNIIASFGIHC